MTPLRVSARNYGPYASVEWEIPAGLTALVGVNAVGDGADSNGAGKTKLLELVPLCLFGPSLPWSEYLTTGGAETTCTVSLEFEQADRTYRVRRTYDSRGRGKTTLDFEELVENFDPDGSGITTGAQPLTRSSQTETQALIEQTIGMSEATFAHSVFAAQGARHFADPALPPRERKAIFTEALNLGVWDDLKKLVDADITKIRGELDALEQRLGAFQDDLDSQPQVQAEHDELTAQVALANADLTEYESVEGRERAALAALEAVSARRQIAQAEVTTLAVAHDALVEQYRAAVEATGAVADIARRIADLKPIADQEPTLRERAAQLTAAQATLRSAREHRASLLTQADDEKGRLVTLTDEIVQYREKALLIRGEIAERRNGNPGVCDHCGQELAGAALAKALANLQSDAELLEARVLTETETHGRIAARIVSLQEQASAVIADDVDAGAQEELTRLLNAAISASSEITTLRERLVQTEQLAAKAEDEAFLSSLDQTREAHEAAERTLAALPEVEEEGLAAAKRAVERANTDTLAARATERQVATLIAASGERLRNLASLAERAQETQIARAGLQSRLDVLVPLSRSYGRDGIPVLLLETLAIPHVETEAARVLEELGMPFRIELVTQRETQKGGLKDTLDVVVHSPAGARRYETYSGGERTRLELALRIALARLIAHRSESHCDLLALDEPSWLDATGMAQLAEVLRGLTEFRSVVLISHDERLVEAFDQRVTVVRDDAGSRLEDAA